MDRKFPFPRLSFLLMAGLTLIGVILRTVCMLTQYDATAGYFDAGLLPTLSTAMYYVMVAVAVGSALIIPKGMLRHELTTPHRAPIAYGVGAFLAIFTVLAFITAYTELFTVAGLMKTFMVLVALLASTYFFLTASRDGHYRDAFIWLGYLPIIWCMIAISVTYSDAHVTMNSPVKLSLQMGFLGFMLIMISELRYRFGKALPRAAVAFTSIGAYLSLTASLPLIAAASVITDRLYVLCAGVLFAAGIYGGYMLYCYTHGSDASSAELEDESVPPTDSECQA